MDIIARINQWSLFNPDRIAHLSAGQSMTYGQLHLSSDLLSAYLALNLPSDHSPVAVLGHKENEMLVAFLGAVKSGHPYIPIDVSLPSHRIETILKTSGVSLTLTPEKVRTIVAGESFPKPQPPLKITPDDPWYIIFTSGSTGDPKGVVITAGCLESFVNWMLFEQNLLEQNEIFLNQAPFSFDLSVMDLYLCLSTGGTLFSVTNENITNPGQLFPALYRSGVTVWVSTPSFAQMCLAEPTFNTDHLPALRKFLFCGETLPPDVAGSLLKQFPHAEVWNTYGPTETTCATTSVKVNQDVINRYSPLPVGYAKSDSRVLVVNNLGEVLPENERGEIIILGPNVSPGYFGRPDLNEKSFFSLNDQRAYHSGDWGHYQDGLLFFDGRMDNQIKLHGYRIEPGDIEANLLALPGIQDAVVLPVLKKGRPYYLVAFIILKDRQVDPDYETGRLLKKELEQRLPGYMIPRKFTFLSQFPMTTNGKADRRKLAETLE